MDFKALAEKGWNVDPRTKVGVNGPELWFERKGLQVTIATSPDEFFVAVSRANGTQAASINDLRLVENDLLTDALAPLKQRDPKFKDGRVWQKSGNLYCIRRRREAAPTVIRLEDGPARFDMSILKLKGDTFDPASAKIVLLIAGKEIWSIPTAMLAAAEEPIPLLEPVPLIKDDVIQIWQRDTFNAPMPGNPVLLATVVRARALGEDPEAPAPPTPPRSA